MSNNDLAIEIMNDKEAIRLQQDYIEALEHRLHIARVAILTDISLKDGMEALVDLLTTRNNGLEQEIKEMKK